MLKLGNPLPSFVLLLVLVQMTPSECPYKGDTLLVANSLTECLGEYNYPLRYEDIIRCVAILTPSGKSNDKAILFESVQPTARSIGIPRENYRQCAKDFNKLLDFILTERMTYVQPKVNEKSQHTGMSAKEIVEDAVRFQAEYCRNSQKYLDPEMEKKIVLVNLQFRSSTFKMYVYKENDIVSDSIYRSRSWEGRQLHIVGAIMEKYMRKHKIRDPGQLTLLDIGSQIGWYMMNIAAKGFKVVGFESMRDNEYLIRKNICANPKMNILYINKALGEKEKTCYLYSENKNRGDPGLFCNEGGPNHPAYFNRGAVEVVKLDDFAGLITNVVVIKMDIEEYEHNVIKGGSSIILNRQVPYIQSEFAPHMLKEKGGDPREYLLEFIKAGYSVSRIGFESGFLTPVQIEDLAKAEGIQDIFFTHQSELHS